MQAAIFNAVVIVVTGAFAIGIMILWLLAIALHNYGERLEKQKLKEEMKNEDKGKK